MKDSLSANKYGTSLTEAEILASLDSAISAYGKNDFNSIAKESLSKTKVLSRKGIIKKTKTISKIEMPVVEVVAKKAKLKKVVKLKSKTKKSKKNFTKYIPSFQVLSFVKPVGKIASKYLFGYKKQMFTVALTLIMLAFVGMTTYVAYAYVAANNNDIVKKVSNHVMLPTSETPKVYIIQSEKSEIFQNPLFKGIEVGDNVLSYTNAGKVVIYRSKEDRVVNIVNTSQ